MAGGWFDWLTPFTVLCGVAVVLGYAWLGACWLIWRTDDGLQERARRLASSLAAVMLVLIAVVSLWTPFLHPTFMDRWFGWPGILLTSPVPILVALLAAGFYWANRRQHHLVPFLCALGIFVLCFAGLGISLYPLMVPPDMTIWQAAATARKPAFSPGGGVGADPADPALHRVQLLRFSRQGAGRCPLSLGRRLRTRPLWQRLAWFVALWAGGVIAVTTVATVLRWVLKA